MLVYSGDGGSVARAGEVMVNGDYRAAREERVGRKMV